LYAKNNNSFIGATYRDDVNITDSLFPVVVALAVVLAVVLAVALAVELAAAAAASDENACENCAVPNTL
jgi:hypothetical protein